MRLLLRALHLRLRIDLLLVPRWRLQLPLQ
jgi:hypothetical protein